MRIYNTMTRKKEELETVKPGHVGIYACGPTVYNYFHIGNARPFIIFDTLRRYLEYRGYKVTYVQNFTDIDDKMIARANEQGISVKELADRFIAEYYRDADSLGIKRATVNPRATENIPEIIAIVEKLIERGLAYESCGDVYFSVEKFESYGKLSGQPLENLAAGARIDPTEQKRHPMDFAVWKAQKPGEPAWDSPWGPGRPGWHVECSAMSMKYLGESFDIHAGGQDLVFPHHENEIAQSEGATGKPFARYWMHNGYINVNNQKMAKSAGNFFTVREIISEFDPMAVRLFMLSAHYRSPINFSRELIEQAKAALNRLVNAREKLFELESTASGGADAEFGGSIAEYRKAFIEAMDDDLNTADATAVLFELARECNARFDENSAKADVTAARELLDELAGVLGITLEREEAVPEKVMELVEKRAEARKNRDWKLSDSLRDEIAALGYAVEDTPAGTKVKPL